MGVRAHLMSCITCQGLLSWVSTSASVGVAA